MAELDTLATSVKGFAETEPVTAEQFFNLSDFRLPRDIFRLAEAYADYRIELVVENHRWFKLKGRTEEFDEADIRGAEEAIRDRDQSRTKRKVKHNGN